jgi:type 1 glutamine amidotransferase
MMKKAISWSVGLLLGMCWGGSLVQAADTSGSSQGKRPVQIVLVAYEDEYHAAETLPRFAQQLSDRFGYRCSVLVGHPDHGVVGLEKLATADVLVLYVRRHPLPKQQMAMIRRYLNAGKPLVALRTSSHAFSVWGQAPPGVDVWPEFDHDVLGGNYHDHYKPGPRTSLAPAPNAAQHPILAGIQFAQWSSTSSLYKVSPLRPGATELLTGKCDSHTEPIAWTHTYHGGRVFYTSLGNVQDFQTPQFVTMLINAIDWVIMVR